jgi:hypothetical protein
MLNAVSVGRACATRTAAALAGFLCSCGASGALASEGGASFYIPGLTMPMAGFLPPPGVFFDNTTYFYQGKLTSGRNTAIGGNVVAGVKVDVKVDFATALWVTPLEILGGNLGLSLSLPFGEPAVRAGAVLSGPILTRRFGRPIGISTSDSTFNYGDPVLSTMVGWHAGNWHWKVAAAVNVPAGAYQPGELSNVALNRWLGDFSGAITYLDPALGIDLSAAAGITVNGENPDTDYRTGKEVHFEAGVTKHLTKELSVGLMGAHYRQITGDSGPGATLGPYKGRATVVGGMIRYDFTLGHTPISTKIKLLKEVEVENRPQGTIALLQVSFPLWVAPHTATPPRHGL